MAVSRIVQNTKISEMHNLLSQGRKILHSKTLQMDLALASSLPVEGKTDLEKFKYFGWG
jgi:hypothetical protein